MKRLLILLFAAGLVAGCATTAAPPEERDPRDPWEPFNRSVYQFNRGVDRAMLRPVARGYDTVTPQPVQRGVGNFFTNLRSPVTIVNLLLQGRPGDSGRAFERFFVNTVFGVAGLFDVASAGGLERYNADFGQTMATWGWESSRYLMLPFLGPSTVRDGFGRVADAPLNPEWYLALEQASYYLLALDIIQTRAALLPRDADLEAAFDEYLFLRDAWLQRREFLIHGDDAPLPDYDDFLDDDEDW